MKFIILACAALIVSLIAISCKSKKFTTDNMPDNRISWGSGGGFTGKETNYILLENGQMFKKSGLDAAAGLTEIKTIKAKVAKAMMSAAKDLNLGEAEVNSPGNMYYFVEVPGATKPIRLTWGDAQTPPPAKVKDFYVVLNQLVLEGKNAPIDHKE